MAQDGENEVPKFNELLFYTIAALQSAPKDKIKDIVLGFYSPSEILDAKKVLYDDYKEVVGKPPTRRGSQKRREEEADICDLLEALDKLDRASIMPQYCAKNAIRIPMITPEVNKEHFTCVMEMKAIVRRVEALESVCNKSNTPIVEENKQLYTDVVKLPPKLPPVEGKKCENGSSSSRSTVERSLLSARTMDSVPYRRPVYSENRATPRQGQSSVVRHNRVPNKIAVGTGKKCVASSGLRGAPIPNREYFIYNVAKQESIERVTSTLIEMGIVVLNIEKVSHADARSASFKLTTSAESSDTVMDPDIWAPGIKVRRFFPRKTRMVEQTETEQEDETNNTSNKTDSDIVFSGMDDNDNPFVHVNAFNVLPLDS